MNPRSKIARRSFLLGSAAIAGGVAFGVYTVKSPHSNPLLSGLAEGEASFSPWVKISGRGITFITPHLNVGQGVTSMQAALIAEEMDVEFGQFETSYGEPSPAYWNHAIGPELVPFRSTDSRWHAQFVKDIGTAAIKVMGLQGTGGSSATPDSFVKLRRAGAIARETLKKAASQRTGVAIHQLVTREAAVHLPNGSSIPYTDLAAEAASLRPVTDVTLRGPEEWRFIGQPMQRLDIVAKSSGTQAYTIDLAMDGMVHAAVRVNPRRGGHLERYDATAAQSMRGVIRVLEVTDGVAVIADNTWRAFQAVDAIDCDWGEAPYPPNQEDHWRAVAHSFTRDHLDAEWRHDGNVETGLRVGEMIEAEYRAPYVAHAPLEPVGALILVTDDEASIWAAQQMPGYVERFVAEITGHDIEAVHFHNQHAGGSFGHRLEFEYIKLAAEIGNQMRGVPVKLTFSREEDFSHEFPRQIGMARAKGSVSNGRIETLDLEVATVSPTESQARRLNQPLPGPDVQIAAGAWNLPYEIPNFRMRAYKVPELAPSSSWRSVGASTQGFFADSFVDELCHAAGVDPLEERLRMMSHEVSRKVLEAVAEMSNWGTPLGDKRGRGVAFVESFGVPVAEVVEVTDTEDGIRIDTVFVAADAGTIIDPINFDNNVKGAVIWGLGHAMNSEVTYFDGAIEQSNYDSHPGMRLYQCPEIVVRGLENAAQIRGIGEPPVPPAAPALANAIFAATGTRLREMPFNRFVDFV